MEIARDVRAVRTAILAFRAAGGPITLVPTMGALHAGHLSLIDQARANGGPVVASIFVNPRQFGANEDFGRYPRQEAADMELLRAAGCNLLFMPAPENIYAPGYATNISVGGLGDGLEGAHRPGHFDGVSTIVAKLFNVIQPDIAIFGEKDWQQLAIIRRMARDLDFPIDIRGAPTVRDTDGLALSSRNAYLSAEERAAAAILPQTLQITRQRIEQGDPVPETLAMARDSLLAGGFSAVDYIALADAETLELLENPPVRPARLLAAAHIGRTRLIDNIAIPHNKS